MARPKLPNEISNEKLLELLDTAKPETADTKASKYDIISFLTHFDIKPGDQLIKARLLYDLYRQWSKHPVPIALFGSEVTKYLLVHSYGRNTFYKLNQEAFKLSEKAFKLMSSRKINKPKSPRFRQHFENFLKHYGLKGGTVWIEGYVLFYLYDKWVYNINKSKPFGYNTFLQMCKLYFKHKRRTTSQMEWYAVDAGIKKLLSEETMNEIRLGKKLRDEREEKRKNKKIKN
jgi:hypothetical protein